MKIVALKCPHCGNSDNITGRELEIGLEFKCPVCDTVSILVSQGDTKTLDGLLVLKTPMREYVVQHLLTKGDICNLFLADYTLGKRTETAIFKVARSPIDNDLVQNESDILKRLSSADDGKFTAFFPKLLETFLYQDSEMSAGRNANILGFDRDIPSLLELYSLAEVKNHYVGGIESGDMAWMWRRLLLILGFAHDAGTIHGAILPTHVLIHPKLHAVILIDWSYAVHNAAQTKGYIRAISSPYEAWYPSAVLDKQMPATGLDISMGAKTMIDVLGGDAVKGDIPKTVPKELRKYFEGFVGKSNQSVDAWSALKEFDGLLEKLWGERTFKPFTMPSKHLGS
jgi:serine/threonine protein kinase